ncbi:hypothetical protein J2T57_001319 [Natronocella acetinitrilica]|uniref:Uncharacterized protein n=1 Tax=Natronocella acetinitrilica TaxID=414046 RepID=A0AAE3G5H2_9GAMM|nr:hypothetical protein [Natronocella acetinitrilica]MCP1674217.1 hypothetical protein [Natronocella acetinitrilica]
MAQVLRGQYLQAFESLRAHRDPGSAAARRGEAYNRALRAHLLDCQVRRQPLAMAALEAYCVELVEAVERAERLGPEGEERLSPPRLYAALEMAQYNPEVHARAPGEGSDFVLRMLIPDAELSRAEITCLAAALSASHEAAYQALSLVAIRLRMSRAPRAERIARLEALALREASRALSRALADQGLAQAPAPKTRRQRLRDWWLISGV